MWKDYEADLERNLKGLHSRVQQGAYLAASSADADEVTNELSAKQSPPNSRRFSNLVSFTRSPFHSITS